MLSRRSESLPAILRSLRLPAFGAPMFLVSHPPLVLAQCRAGIVGAFPALNARPQSQLDEWLAEIAEALDGEDAAPFAVNLIVHRTNPRLEDDLALCVRRKVPIVISSLGARPEVNEAVHAYGGIVLHDVIHDRHARKAIEMGADGLIAVAAGAGGHGGTLSPFALVQEIREWFDGPLLLSGSIATGGGVLAARAMGADFAYIGSPFIATEEARASDAYKRMIVDSTASDIVGTAFFTGVFGNYLKGSVRNAGLDPEDLPDGRADAAFGGDGERAWKDVWGAGHGVGAVDGIVPAADLVQRLFREYEEALSRLSV